MSSMWSTQEVLQALPGARLIGDPTQALLRVHTDSRSLQPGDLFVALRGERFDANDFLAEAVAAGAVALLCHPQDAPSPAVAAVPRIEVSDTRAALASLASAWRARQHLGLIAVTGSNGKTTVTQMLAAILHSACGPASLATQGNLNNDIGVPLTLLRLRAQHRLAVVELGMNHPGEIASLAAMAQPGVALVNNAQREHLEFMQTVEAVARENGQVIAALPAHGVAVFPADDAYTPLWRTLAGARRCVCFALEGAPDANTLVGQRMHWAGDHWAVQAEGLGVQLTLQLHIAGRHNVKNALAAAACALAAGVAVDAVQNGLAQFVPVKGRSRAQTLRLQGRRITLVDDTYNANPDSVRAAIDVLAELAPPRLLVLGDMGEVGSQGPQLHAEAGRYAHSRGIEHLLALGPLSEAAVAEFAQARHFDSMAALVTAVRTELGQCNSVLVKGSRFMRMEQVIAALSADSAHPEETPCS